MSRSERFAAIAAALVLMIGMGFGRFAFTGLYPLMIVDNRISVEGGSYAASANYAGYLIGALLAGGLSGGMSSRNLCAFSVIATAVSLTLLGVPLPEWLIVTIRGFAGVFSAVAMVAASHWLIHDRGHHHGAPALFAGVGAGILLSAEIIAAGHAAALSSGPIWLLLGASALVLAAVTVVMQARADRLKPAAPESARPADDGALVPFGATRLILVYGLAGFGYIITATYLPLLVRTALGAVDPVHVWAVFGLGAVPSCFLWHALHVRWGTGRSLMANLLLQAIGVALPVTHAPAAYIASAVLVGGTFMGTVTIAMPAARRVAAKVRFNMVAIMTASYGVGQIAGPLVASFLYARMRSFDHSLLLAAAALALGALLCVPAYPARRLVRWTERKPVAGGATGSERSLPNGE
ncbi:MAG: YbfB/YjiJ family MFS transporter [Pseudochelatococcus sp.]|jgi:MFS family permease|uniref:YbfB/YjiJ family MFS transporter n=1 Tax=Pseudochelatococcus sp. TaxID=2020869 RepID=UPI003D8A7622